MRARLMCLLLASFVAVATAQEPKKVEPKQPPKKAEPTLKVGDAAPTLKADKWLQGTEVTEFAKGKVYVVEFWATWCGPCIVMMPHLNDLQAEYRDKGVTIVGYSAKDPNNTADKVAAFVQKRGPKLGYTFAYADTRETYSAWMQAAGRNGIPCTFVVDRDGKIAYIGHPMYLDAVLPKVVAGKWTDKDNDALKAVEEEVTAVFTALRGDPEKALSTIAEFEKKHPEMSDIPYFRAGRIGAMLKLKKHEETAAALKKMLAKAVKQSDPAYLQMVSTSARSPDAAGQKELLAISVEAADALLKLNGETDLPALLNANAAAAAAGLKDKATAYAKRAVPLAEKEVRDDKDYAGMLRAADAQFAAGDAAAAKKWAEKAVEAAPMTLKKAIESRVKKYLGEDKSDK